MLLVLCLQFLHPPRNQPLLWIYQNKSHPPSPPIMFHLPPTPNCLSICTWPLLQPPLLPVQLITWIVFQRTRCTTDFKASVQKPYSVNKQIICAYNQLRLDLFYSVGVSAAKKHLHLNSTICSVWLFQVAELNFQRDISINWRLLIGMVHGILGPPVRATCKVGSRYQNR